MSGTQNPSGSVEPTALTGAIRAGDEEAFNHLAGRHRRELLIHCYRMPPQAGIVVGRDAMLKLWVDAGFGSERFGRLRCVLTRANLQPAVAYYMRRPGDAAWRALTLDVLRIEEGMIAEIVTFAGTVFPRFGLPLTIDEQAADGTS